MSKTLPLIKRKAIIKDFQKGASISKLSKEHEVCYETVRRLCKRFSDKGESGLLPRYKNCGPQEIKSDPFIYRTAIWLKRLHRKWGAPLIKLILEKRYPNKKVPSVRTLQNWYRKTKLNRPRTKHPSTKKQWAKRVHEVWQIDGNEENKLANDKWACWLTVVDEHSGSLIAAPAFSKKEFIV